MLLRGSLKAGPSGPIAARPGAAARLCNTATLLRYRGSSVLHNQSSSRAHQQDTRCHSAAWSKEDIEELIEEQDLEQEYAIGEAWLDQFVDDIDALYEYPDRDLDDKQRQVENLMGIPKTMWRRSGIMHDLQLFSPGLAADMIGMGTWRLKGSIDGVINFVVGRIENSFRELLENDLTLYPPSKWKDKGWDFIDSIDPEREWDGWAYADIPDPERGEEGYPRLQIENRIYCSRVFRKLHLEVAWRQDGLHIFHMVLFPRTGFDCPILAMDLVAANGQVSLAIIDACPVRRNKYLPEHYTATMQQLQKRFLPDATSARRVPEWGQRIFSPHCVCIRPSGPEELAGFVKYSIALSRAHLMYSRLLTPITPINRRDVVRLEEIAAGQREFCEQQLANKKTARVLEAALGEELTQQYMTQCMFDDDPSDDPPYFDGSVAKLYRHFDEVPEVWPDAQRFMATQKQLDDSKAQGYLQSWLTSSTASDAKLSWALEHLFNSDEQFKAAVVQVLPEAPQLAAQGELMPALLQQLKAMQPAAAQQQASKEAAKQESKEQEEEGKGEGQQQQQADGKK